MTHFLAVDVETTGLEDDDLLLEVAWAVLDGDLEQLTEIRSMLVCVDPAEAIAKLRRNAVAYEMHRASGLTLDLLHPKAETRGARGVVRDIEMDIMNHVPTFEKPYLLGNSVDFDRRVLTSADPTFASTIHYRNLDVRALQEIAASLGQEDRFAIPDSQNAHRAADDIAWSIAYAQNFRRIVGEAPLVERKVKK